MATFGQITPGANSDARNSQTLTASKFTLTKKGIVKSMSLYCKVASGTSKIKLAIYTDSSGPSSKLGVTEEVSVSNTSSAWKTGSFATPLKLSAGSYWLAFMQDNLGTGFEYSNDVVADAEKNNSGTTYATFPDPFGVTGTLSRQLSIYATYSTRGGAALIYQLL